MTLEVIYRTVLCDDARKLGLANVNGNERKKVPKPISSPQRYTQCLKFTKNVSLKVNKIEIFSLKSATLKIPQKA